MQGVSVVLCKEVGWWRNCKAYLLAAHMNGFMFTFFRSNMPINCNAVMLTNIHLDASITVQ